MIVSFRDRETETFAAGREVRAFRSFAEQARKRLRILDAATSIADLRALPSNRLEALRGKRRGQWSVRINMKWRICFVWDEDDVGPSGVEIADYHDE